MRIDLGPHIKFKGDVDVTVLSLVNSIYYLRYIIDLYAALWMGIFKV